MDPNINRFGRKERKLEDEERRLERKAQKYAEKESKRGRWRDSQKPKGPLGFQREYERYRKNLPSRPPSPTSGTVCGPSLVDKFCGCFFSRSKKRREGPTAEEVDAKLAARWEAEEIAAAYRDRDERDDRYYISPDEEDRMYASFDHEKKRRGLQRRRLEFDNSATTTDTSQDISKGEPLYAKVDYEKKRRDRLKRQRLIEDSAGFDTTWDTTGSYNLRPDDSGGFYDEAWDTGQRRVRDSHNAREAMRQYNDVPYERDMRRGTQIRRIPASTRTNTGRKQIQTSPVPTSSARATRPMLDLPPPTETPKRGWLW